jgi:hypothetical protein
MTPFIIDDSKERYQARLDAAERWRLAKSVRNPGHNRYNWLRAAMGDRLGAPAENTGGGRRGQSVMRSLAG